MRDRAAAGDFLDGLAGSSSKRSQTMRDAGNLPVIRAGVLRHLLTQADWPVDAKGVRLRDIRVSGPFDLEAAQVRCPLRLEHCQFDDPTGLLLDFATASLLVLRNCRFTTLSGNGLVLTVGLDLTGSVVDGAVELPGARIGGALVCRGTRLGADDFGNAFIGGGMSVRLSTYFSGGFKATGAVSLPRAEIGGQLQFRGAQLGLNRNRTSFDGESIKIGGSAFFDKGFVSAGAVLLSGAHIQGQLICQGAKLGRNTVGDALVGEVMTVSGGVALGTSAEGTVFTTQGALRLADSQITGFLRCQGAQLGSNESKNSLHGQGLRVDGSVYLDRGFAADGAVWLAGAIISGQLRCRGRIGANDFGNALIGDGIRVGGGLLLDTLPDGTGFVADGALRLAGADITGSLKCCGAQLDANREGNALDGDEMRVSVSVLLDKGFTASGAVRLPGARIGGQLRCRSAQIGWADQDGDALVADGVVVGGAILLDHGFKAHGAVRLSAADVGGDVSLQGARLGKNEEQRSLIGDGIKASRDIRLDRAPDGCAFSSSGVVRLPSAGITGSLRCQAAHISGQDQDGDSLIGNGIRIGDSVFLSAGFLATGAVRLSRADIMGSLTCASARLGTNGDQNSFIGEAIRVGRDTIFSSSQDGSGFTASGAVQLTGADIGGQLSFRGANLGLNRRDDSLVCSGVRVGGSVDMDGGFKAAGAINCSRTNIGGSFRWEPAEEPKGAVNLESARAGQLADDWSIGRPGGYWPKGRLLLAGFAYGGFGGDNPATVEQRLEWIRDQYDNVAKGAGPASSAGQGAVGTDPRFTDVEVAEKVDRPGSGRTVRFTTQPYKQLADVYRQAGQEAEATAVEIARRQDLRHWGSLSAPGKAWNTILDVTIKYGFKTWRILIAWVALFLIVFGAAFLAQHQKNLIVPTTATAASVHANPLTCKKRYPCFFPAGYSVDLVVPVINVHQEDYWRFNGHHPWGWVWVGGAWLATAFGWSIATLLVVGYSGLARRE
jgi:hypothetical protein